MYRKYIKRMLDFILSLVTIIILSPLFIIICILIKSTSEGPIFFLQERVGIHQNVFKIIKFRTMIVNAEHIGDGLKVKEGSDPRITRIGKFLRKTSLDELPQLFNICKGDMSIIGPRPPVTYHPYQIGEYDDFKKRRFDARPGLTGLAQSEVRNSATWDERIEYDVRYVQDISFINDVKIILKTVWAVFSSKNIYANQ
ncbi:sugar transferase [Candidatus Stoquefichus massiliensis]|uniref:sugar transferase n=1 Tax=Candidatus Stoquefichus massiliensis TaxID=1470350 RepID=UPI0004848D46|nr:sugar transferase [Candidatus Stoquefichus massiliensis]